MIHHVSIKVSDYARSRDFYQAVLSELGYELFTEVERSAGFGVPGQKCGLWISEGDPAPQIHFCFRAATRNAVDGFYQKAIAAGARTKGEPGVRTEHHPHYYTTFVLDPDGYCIEAVCTDHD